MRFCSLTFRWNIVSVFVDVAILKLGALIFFSPIVLVICQIRFQFLVFLCFSSFFLRRGGLENILEILFFFSLFCYRFHEIKYLFGKIFSPLHRSIVIILLVIDIKVYKKNFFYFNAAATYGFGVKEWFVTAAYSSKYFCNFTFFYIFVFVLF